jgi:DNA-binding winged helix-turn-helix (wHTH) protein
MRYTFGDCRLDIASRELTVRGEPVHLSPKAFELLRKLIEDRPRVVTKQELMNALWPNTFVVEANLPVIVKELRSAVGDRSSDASVIRTHHGVGYSFVAAVRESRSRLEPAGGAVMRWVLKVGNRRIALGPGPNAVGRDDDSEVYLNDASVSRNHARIAVRGDDVSVEDLDSKNGTRVNGELLVSPRRIVDGDEIEFGTIKTRLIATTANNPSTLTI